MPRARSFFPLSRTLLTTWLTRALRNTGSGAVCRFWAGARRISAPSGLLGAVTGARLLAFGNPGGVECPPDHLVSDAGKVADPAPTHQDDAVLLEVVALTGDVRGDLHP